MRRPGTAAAPKNGSISVLVLQNYKYTYNLQCRMRALLTISAGHAAPVSSVLPGGGETTARTGHGAGDPLPAVFGGGDVHRERMLLSPPHP